MMEEDHGPPNAPVVVKSCFAKWFELLTNHQFTQAPVTADNGRVSVTRQMMTNDIKICVRIPLISFLSSSLFQLYLGVDFGS